MTWTVDTGNSGTLTATVGTESTVVSGDTANGTYVFLVDLTNLAIADIVELRVYTEVLSGGALDEVWKRTFGPSPPIIIVSQSDPIASDQSIKCTIKQVAGTGRSFPWKLLRT